MGCCAGKSFNISDGMKQRMEGIKKKFVRSLSVNRRTIKRESSGTRPFDSEIPLNLLTDRKKTKEEIEEICTTLQSHFLFKTLDHESLKYIANQMLLLQFEANKLLFSQGDNGYYFYLIFQGSIEIIINNIPKSRQASPSCFGELALLYDFPRTATIKTLENSKFWVINREKFREAVKAVSNNVYTETESFLNSLNFFKSLTAISQSKLISCSSYMEFTDSQIIISEGDPGDLIYIIKSGQVKCSISKHLLRILSKGEIFGEIAAIFKTNRSATVKAVGKVTVLAFGSEICLELLQGKELFRNLVVMALENSVFKVLNQAGMSRLAFAVKVRSVKNGDVVVGQGRKCAEGLGFVLKGRVVVGDEVYQKGDIVGVREMISGDERVWECDGVMMSDGYFGFISHQELQEALGGDLNTIIKQNEIINIIQKVYLFKPLPIENLEKICDKFYLETYKKGSIIYQESENLSFFFIVKSGQIGFVKGAEISKTFIKSDYYGEGALLNSEIIQHDIISFGNSELWKLNRNDFLSILDESIINQLRKRMDIHHSEIELKNLNLVKVLGTGTSGNVYLVHHPVTDKLYALKVFLKSTINQMKIFELILMEKAVMQEIDHPLLTKMVKTFKDEYRLYFLLEYISGIEFFEIMLEKGLIPESQTRFYTACIVMALNHIHSRSILYRDLKPENIMIDIEGYPVLIDFGVSKIVTDRTFTLIGTPHYMAPEIVQGSGYSLPCDCWSLGVLIYECLFGKLPFGNEEDDLYSIYKEIISCPLKFPKKIVDIPAKSLIESLLCVNPDLRPTIQECKKDPWFEGINWDYLLGRFVKSPYLPSLAPIDTASGQPIEDIIYVIFN